jgi:hypothetical protein
VRPEGLGKLKKFIHVIRLRTRDLRACSTVPKPLRCRVLQIAYYIIIYMKLKKCVEYYEHSLLKYIYVTILLQ